MVPCACLKYTPSIPNYSFLWLHPKSNFPNFNRFFIKKRIKGHLCWLPKYAKPKIWQAMIWLLFCWLPKLAKIPHLDCQIYSTFFAQLLLTKTLAWQLLVVNQAGSNFCRFK